MTAADPLATGSATHSREPGTDEPADGHVGDGRGPAQGPTAAQLRRFIKSRPYVPLHELRRRFELNGETDDVTAVQAPDGLTVFVGLPERESRLLAELARDGDVGLEMSRDPRVPIVVGVFPIRPITRG
jgi:hypothetical protein